MDIQEERNVNSRQAVARNVHLLRCIALSDSEARVHLALVKSMANYTRHLSVNPAFVERLKSRSVVEVKSRTDGACNVKIRYELPNGELHHTEKDEHGHTLPAVILAGGSQFWYKDDKVHRDDNDEHGHTLPAAICADGSQRWYKDGKLHRDEKDENGRTLPAWIAADGSRAWYKDGKQHRDDKDETGRTLPAGIFADGSQYWCKDGQLHRDDKDENGRTLPAQIWADGDKLWYKDGVQICESAR